MSAFNPPTQVEPFLCVESTCSHEKRPSATLAHVLDGKHDSKAGAIKSTKLKRVAAHKNDFPILRPKNLINYKIPCALYSSVVVCFSGVIDWKLYISAAPRESAGRNYSGDHCEPFDFVQLCGENSEFGFHDIAGSEALLIVSRGDMTDERSHKKLIFVPLKILLNHFLSSLII